MEVTPNTAGTVALLAVLIWTAVWINREVPVPVIGSGLSSSAITLAYRVVVSCVAVVAVAAPVLLLAYVLTAIFG